VVECGLSHAVEQRFPRVVERELPEVDEVVERGLPRAVEHELLRVVERELPEELDAVEMRDRRPDADEVFRRPSPADVIECGFSQSVAADAIQRPVRRRGRRTPRRSRTSSEDSEISESEIISVLTSCEGGSSPRVQGVEVALPPCDAADITALPGLSWKNCFRDLNSGEIEQVCMIVAEDAASLAAVEVKADDPASDDRTRPKAAEQKSARAARYVAQSLEALEASDNPAAPLVRKFIDCFPDKVPAALPPDRGVRHEIDLTPRVKYCVTRQWPLPRDQVEAIDSFFKGRQQAGHVRESLSPHSSPTFCVKKASGGWRIVHAFNKLNDATIPAQTLIPRKDMVLDTMSGNTQYSAIDLMDGFYQILMREGDVPLTAVSTPSGMLWEWLVMPQGLKNAPATFNRMISNLLRPFRDFAPSYFDDIFIHSHAERGKTGIEVRPTGVRGDA
jgi:hypothetical protein